MSRKSLVDGLIFVGLGAGCLAEGYRLYVTRDLRALHQNLWPGLYVLLMGAALIITGVSHLILNMKVAGAKSAAANGAGLWKVGQTVAALVSFALLIDFIGYPAASFLFFLMVTTIFGIGSWAAKTALCFALAAVFYVLFVHYLGVVFPRGALIEFLA